MKRISAIFTAISMLAVAPLYATPRPTPTHATTMLQEMPKPAPELAKLKFLEGKWTYESVYEKGDFYPNGAKTKGTYSTIAGPGGFSQIADFTEAAPEGEEAGHMVTNWDVKEHVYKSYVFGNAFPQCVIRTGHWDGDKLIFESEFDMGSMKMALQSVTIANADGTVTIKESYKGADGAWKLISTGIAKKVQ
jgi:Protein of unknown function (DUF1579)